MNKIYLVIPREGSRFPAFLACVRALEDISLKENGATAWVVGDADIETPPGFLCNATNITGIRPLGLGPYKCDHLV